MQLISYSCLISDINIPAPPKNGVSRAKWSTAEKTSCNNYTTTLLYFYLCTLNSEVNSWGVISLPVVQIPLKLLCLYITLSVKVIHV